MEGGERASQEKRKSSSAMIGRAASGQVYRVFEWRRRQAIIALRLEHAPARRKGEHTRLHISCATYTGAKVRARVWIMVTLVWKHRTPFANACVGRIKSSSRFAFDLWLTRLPRVSQTRAFALLICVIRVATRGDMGIALRDCATRINGLEN